MPDDTTKKTDTNEAIAKLNDQLRRHGIGGRTLITAGVQSLPPHRLAALRLRIAAFDEFTDDNDPWRERDFGAVDFDGQRYFWKIDYYDPSLTHHSDDPTDPILTARVMTIMRADEY